MFRKVLIANRGEIARRIQRTLRELGVQSVAIHSEPDRHALHVLEADEAYCVGEARVAESYLRVDRILEIARRCGAEAIHPGYGLLSENAAFAEACEAAGIAFIGPTPDQLRNFGLKHTARALAQQAGVPLLAGSELLDTPTAALEAAQAIGYPVMLKSTAGGGGIGMRLCPTPSALEQQFRAVTELAEKNFGHAGLFLERFVSAARHVEVQIFGDGRGRVVTLGERDCSVQRRHQKVIEETPAPDLSAEVRQALHAAARKLGEAVNYRSAGTVEFIYDAGRGDFSFLEVNTRLQVEHGVTELVMGVDLVAWMVKLAAGEPIDFSSLPAEPRGHAMEARIYAEDPAREHAPAAGLLTAVELPQTDRVDHWIEAGTEVSPYYDPLLAKVMTHGTNRAEALARLAQALDETRIHGIETNVDYLSTIARHPAFQAGGVTTGFLAEVPAPARSVEVLDGGIFTTVQDHPGRGGYWRVGVPPSGPMDAQSFRLGNALLGNASDAAGLECTLRGPTLRFRRDTVICLTGAPAAAHLDEAPVPMWQALPVRAGQTLRVGEPPGPGQRTYLLFAGGLDIPLYMGSRSTFQLGQFGGHAGRTLRTGDVLRLFPDAPTTIPERRLPRAPAMDREWTLRVLYGPHGAPDFFTGEDIAEFFAASWEVHYNSARTGVRLVGPKPRWARTDGGEAGLHPSNIHDNAYAIGTVDFTGDMPVILGPDGPSLGGFVCPATVIKADLWKLGQLRPGDVVHFAAVERAEAEAAEEQQEALIHAVATGREAPAPAISPPSPVGAPPQGSPILAQLFTDRHPTGVVYRQSGQNYLLVEYGEQVLDLELRARVHALMMHLRGHPLPGIVEMTPGIRSLQIHFDNRAITVDALVEGLILAEGAIPDASDLHFPSRIVHLPLSWDDEATRLAIRKYEQSVRKDAPWCPSNIEFIRRINGLDTVEEVKRIVFDASYLVLGLGDVYLGAPVATPMDPRHRLVTTKYNPARTWTPENAVGIGGAYLCVYGMEGPGGYQFVGRTVQMWNRYRQTAEFTAGRPWLLRFFDQIRFHEVPHEELMRRRDGFPYGRYPLQIEETEFKLADYKRFLAEHKGSIDAFKSRQQAAFDAERERWAAAGIDVVAAEAAAAEPTEEALEDGATYAAASMPGSVWKILVAPGDRVEAGAPVAILESMKMEVPVTALEGGTVSRLLVAEGASVQAGQRMVSILP